MQPRPRQGHPGDTLALSPLQTGTTPLFFAAQGGFLDIAQALLDNGAQVDSASVVSIITINILARRSRIDQSALSKRQSGLAASCLRPMRPS